MRACFKQFCVILFNIVLITAGSVLCAMAVNCILIPHNFFGAGFTGISIVLHYIFPFLPVSLIYFVINIPVFSLGWMSVGRSFFLYSIVGMVIYSTTLEYINIPITIQDKIPSALFGGILMGTGAGLILKSIGSAGGLDILCVIFMKRFSIRLGTTILAFNTIILGTGAILFSLEDALYTLIYIYVNSQVVNIMITGLNQRKAIYIISPKWKEISKQIMENIKRGVTVLQGWGGYTGNEQHVLYSIITFRELSRLKPIINQIDPEALVVVSETLEVMGQRIGNQPHW
ncbi:YitT family protein [Thermodesulfobacteriota bacterium]